MAESSCTSSIASTVDLKNYQECSICTGPFDDSRALPCLHPFCCGCLENWAKTCSEDSTIVSCPLCKKVYQIPEQEGIKGFPAHFLVADLQTTVRTAKQKHSTSDLCEDHGEKKIYYCEDCSCAACSDCSALDPTHRGHTFIRLKQAALQQSRSLGDLTRRVKDVKEKYESAVQQAKQVGQDLDQAADAKIKDIKEARDEHMKQVHGLVKAYEHKVYYKREEKRKTVQQLQEKLQSDLAAITSSYELATNVVESGSHSDIITLYPSLSSSLQQLIQSQPSTVDGTLSQIQLKPLQQSTVDLSSLEQLLCDKLHITQSSTQHDKKSTKSRHLSTKPAVTAILSAAATTTADILPSSTSGRLNPTRKRESGQNIAPGTSGSEPTQSSHPSLSSGFPSAPDNCPRKRWKVCGVIKVASQAEHPSGIAIHPNGDIAVTSHYVFCRYGKYKDAPPVAVFSRSGKFKHVIKGSPSSISDIAITHSNQYIIPGKKGSNEFYIYNDQGALLKTIPTYDINNKPSTPGSVAVDSTGRIIVGFGYNDDKTISIYQPDGTLISKFETKSCPRRLTCTPDDRLIISFDDDTLQVMDQSGPNAHIIHPPPGIQLWGPRYVCCSKQGELFVGKAWGDPRGVYMYLSRGGEYMYIDCITTGLPRGLHPRGIALSADEEKLFVVDTQNDVIKLFQ